MRIWKAGNEGAGPRKWFVWREGETRSDSDGNVYYRGQEVLLSRSGNVRRFSTRAAALLASREANKGLPAPTT